MRDGTRESVLGQGRLADEAALVTCGHPEKPPTQEDIGDGML